MQIITFKASPAVQPSQARSKNDQMRVRAVNAPFRQPMIALRSPTTPHMRQNIPVQQGTIANFPTIQGQPSSAIYQFPGQINMGKTTLMGAPHVGQGKFQQGTITSSELVYPGVS